MVQYEYGCDNTVSGAMKCVWTPVGDVVGALVGKKDCSNMIACRAGKMVQVRVLKYQAKFPITLRRDCAIIFAVNFCFLWYI